MKIDSQKILTKRVAKIVRACRKNLGINQTTLAQELGVDQSALSRVEGCKQNLTAQQWFQFCHFVGISPESLSSGLIEISQHPEREFIQGRKLKLPERFAENALSKVRSVQPIIRGFIAKYGEKQFDSFVKKLKLDPDYFVDLNNQINFNFCIDISKYLVQKGAIQRNTIWKLTQCAKDAHLHGSLHYQYDYLPQQGRLQLFETLNSNISRYGENFKFEILDVSRTSFRIGVTPLPHMSEFSYDRDPDLGDFFCEYNRSYLSAFLASDKTKFVRVDVIENQYLDPGANRCIYKVHN
jgi:transcriptional regulator with XRE-family HTH domain